MCELNCELVHVESELFQHCLCYTLFYTRVKLHSFMKTKKQNIIANRQRLIKRKCMLVLDIEIFIIRSLPLNLIPTVCS